MKRRGRELIFMLAMLASFTMLVGCVKKNSENTTATVETPTPTLTETPASTATPEPTATPKEEQTVVSAVEMEDIEGDEPDDREYDQNDTASSFDDFDSNSNDDNDNNNSEGNGNSDVNMNFADDYKPREELSDEEVGYGSDNVPEASGTVASGEGNQAKIASAVYVRSGPGTENEIIGSLSEGDTVVVLGNEDGWLKINYGNKVGYFYQDYVARDW